MKNKLYEAVPVTEALPEKVNDTRCELFFVIGKDEEMYVAERDYIERGWYDPDDGEQMDVEFWFRPLPESSLSDREKILQMVDSEIEKELDRRESGSVLTAMKRLRSRIEALKTNDK
jgi:hypothetical protein